MVPVNIYFGANMSNSVKYGFLLPKKTLDAFRKSVDRRQKEQGIHSLPMSVVMQELMKEHCERWGK